MTHIFSLIYNPESISLLPNYLVNEILSTAEQARSGDFLRETDRIRYILGRLLLRRILSSFMNVPSNHLDIQTNDYGKPYLPNNPVYFNLSHSHNRILIAFNKDNPVGIDIEHKVSNPDIKEIVRECFHHEEQKILHSLEGEGLTDSFYTIWCRKEAFSKATGLGLNLPPTEYTILPNYNCTLELSLTMSAKKLLSTPCGPSQKWAFEDIVVDPAYSACVAVNGELGQLEYKQITFDNLVSSSSTFSWV